MKNEDNYPKPVSNAITKVKESYISYTADKTNLTKESKLRDALFDLKLCLKHQEILGTLTTEEIDKIYEKYWRL